MIGLLMRHLIAALLLTATPVLADDVTTSAQIAGTGLAETAARLDQAPASGDRNLALAAVRFLVGIEKAYQARWRIGATDPLLPVPVLGSALLPNPNPQPMQADFMNDLASDLARSMQATRDTLADDIGNDAALVLRLDDLWLDVDGDGQRGGGEALTDLAGLRLPDTGPAEIRFDASDAHWLRAYTHLIEGMAEVTLAFDPAPALARRIELDRALSDQFAEPPDQMARAPNYDMYARNFGPMIDRIAVLVQTLRNVPDKQGVNRAADHWRAMIAANRDFWTAVATEADNDREWIPNATQQAALGFALPPEAGAAWLAVLDDAEGVLDGGLLIPFWRFAPGHGIDLTSWLDDPGPVDLIDWVQGSGALPHARAGLTVGSQNWDRFLSLFGGRAGLYMVLFN